MIFKLILNKVLKMEQFKGARSYIMAGGAGLSVVLLMLGLIDEQMQNAMFEVFAVGWGFSMRAAVK